jgi:pimeloyl-ACP methyl ester carboxylesterase
LLIADHRRGDSMDAIARQVLAEAPPRFALCGLSMGGYISFAIHRLAPDRVMKLALLDTGSRSDTPEAGERRRASMATVKAGEFEAVMDAFWPMLVHKGRLGDAALKRIVLDMATASGPEAFVRQQQAIVCVLDPTRCHSERAAIGKLLSVAGDGQAIQALLKLFFEQSGIDELYATALTLGLGSSCRGDAQAVKALESMLNDDEVPPGNWWSVGKEALAMLGSMQPPVADYKTKLAAETRRVLSDVDAKAEDRFWAQGYHDGPNLRSTSGEAAPTFAPGSVRNTAQSALGVISG